MSFIDPSLARHKANSQLFNKLCLEGVEAKAFKLKAKVPAFELREAQLHSRREERASSQGQE